MDRASNDCTPRKKICHTKKKSYLCGTDYVQINERQSRGVLLAKHSSTRRSIYVIINQEFNCGYH